MAFAPGELGDVRALALVGNVLYAGGVQPGTYFVPVLRALDATTGDALPISFDVPADARNLVALVATANRLYVAFGSTMFDSRVVAFDAATGSRIWVHSFPFMAFHEGAATLALDVDRTKLLVGGEFDDAGNENLEALDVSTGMPTGPDPPSADRGHLDRRRRERRLRRSTPRQARIVRPGRDQLAHRA